MGNMVMIQFDALWGFAPAAAAPPLRIAPYYLYMKVVCFLRVIPGHPQAPPAFEEHFTFFLSFGSEDPQHPNGGGAGAWGATILKN